jgi:hypothetical protein
MRNNHCWGCGQSLVFRKNLQGQTVAFNRDSPSARPHNCKKTPRGSIFYPAIQDFQSPTPCQSCQGESPIYLIPTQKSPATPTAELPFDRLIYPWQIHHDFTLGGLYDYRIQSLLDECHQHHHLHQNDLALIIAAKRIPGMSALYLVAIKTLFGIKRCDFWQSTSPSPAIATPTPTPGDIVVFSTIENHAHLIINSKNANHHFRWDSEGNPLLLSLNYFL